MKPVWLKEPCRSSPVTKPAKDGEEACAIKTRNRWVQAHLGLVNSVAGHYAARTGEQRDDLQQVAAIGLIRAAERYDSGSLVPFAAFARPHVRGAVLHYLRDVAPLVRLSRRLQERNLQLRRCQQTMASTMGQEASETELCAQLRLSRRQWLELQVASLSGAGCSSGHHQLLQADQEQLPAPMADEPTNNIDASKALSALARLNRRQRRVVEAVVLEGLSLRALANREGSSAATMHRVLHQGLEELRRRLSPASDAPRC